MKVPFFKLTIDRADRREITKTLDSGWLTTGPRCAELETLVHNQAGAGHPVALSSATAGLHLALLALDVGPGDEVITTGFTFSATVAAILYVGATPVLADIDPETLNLDPECVRQKITGKTKAVISVDIAGLPCDYRALGALCRKHKLKLICDAAHSLGAEAQGKTVGNFGDVTVFSFYSTKTVTTAEGGLALCRSRKTADRIRRLSLHGMDRTTFSRDKKSDWRYDVTELGFKYNLSDLSAALGVARMKRLDSLLSSRAQAAGRYDLALEPLADLIDLPPRPYQFFQAWHLYIIKLKTKRWRISRDTFISEMKRQGIGTGVHYIPVYHLSAFARILKVKPGSLPHTERAFSHVVSLPLYPELKAADIKIVASAVSEVARRFASAGQDTEQGAKEDALKMVDKPLPPGQH
ncbi:MAG: DegT/DnrJ/EryC1/StrS aminotransferase family protein [candidate division Zixibacteria bacterium]|nr:DegT/DnrJ/EryC1/StrS aminotransferase family protein [candidate division Zixibacteria bacterium]